VVVKKAKEAENKKQEVVCKKQESQKRKEDRRNNDVSRDISQPTVAHKRTNDRRDGSIISANKINY
jgi:hypothetical protein